LPEHQAGPLPSGGVQPPPPSPGEPATIGNVAVPTALVAGPMKVTAPNQVTGSLCNLSGSAMTVSGLGIRIITLG